MEELFYKYEIIEYLNRKNSVYYGKIKELYELCKYMLSSIPSFFSSYTLHDIDHSIRVIGYMNDLIKNQLEYISETHIALIVFVGLLHDIGMVVSPDEKELLYSHFMDTNYKFKDLSYEEQMSYLADHIRNNHGKRVNDVLKYKVNDNTDIKSFLYVGNSLSYDLSDIVAKICQSHRESPDWIVENLPSNCEYEMDSVNPQHIAFLLRIADVLDIDDRRAPYMLYKVINPKGIGDIEWKKHIPITNYNKIKYINNDMEIYFSGICKEPTIYRKITEYLDWIDEDLKQIIKITDNFMPHYQLKIKAPISRDIKTQGFVNTSLKFKLDYNQVIKLLMGEKIYGNKREGLRELLQNSIDAVLLMRDIQKNNNEYTYNSYHPEIKIITSKKNNSFCIIDNGTGMTEEILNNYFFNVGSSYYLSDEFDKTSYEYQPIGHFGIGFLSCFMLSSKIELKTKYFKSEEEIHLIFDKDSPYVTRLNTQKGTSYVEHGTKIVMEYDQIIPNVFEDENSVVSYVKELLLIEDYDIIFVDQDEKTEYKIETPRFEKIQDNNDEKIEFTYDLNSDIDVRFNIFDFFPDNEKVYIVKSSGLLDSWDFVSLDFYEESLNCIDIEIQTSITNLQEIIGDIDTLNYMAISDFVIDLIMEIDKKNLNKNNFRFYLEQYLYKFISKNSLEWYDIPIILNKDTFNNFVDCVECDGIEKALKKYDGSVITISVICKEKLTDKLLIDIISNYISLSVEDVGNIIDIGYYGKYPIKPIKNKIKLYGFSDSNCYLKIVQRENINASYYLKGIHINDETSVTHYEVEGIDLQNICLNIKKGLYDTDISRNNFSTDSKRILVNKMICVIYQDIMRQKILDESESDLIKKFLKDFYNFDMN